ncbi:MAG: hypothetical protein AAFN59_08025 [Pseudomonadota bacterium]
MTILHFPEQKHSAPSMIERVIAQEGAKKVLLAALRVLITPAPRVARARDLPAHLQRDIGLMDCGTGRAIKRRP